VTTLLIDNYDSYTYNVYHLLAAVSGDAPIVVRNDSVSWRALSRWDFDAIVLSPGPGRPERWHDFGVCADILRSSAIPVLGVCLGHQGLGHLLDGEVRGAPVVMHGRLSAVKHDGGGLFADIPQDFSVVRYHSLAVDGELGPQGRVSAWTEEGVVMGIEHRSRPLWGVQFHPESIATEHGRKLFENFYELARRHRAEHGRPVNAPRPPAHRPRRAAARAARAAPRLLVRTLAGEPSTELLFERLFATASHAFWLDSADAPTPLAQCSFLGTTAGRERCVIEYDVHEKAVSSHRTHASTVELGSIFDVLDRELAKQQIEPPASLPRGLLGGYVGYIGYECKADCGSPNVHRSDMPDAVLMLANRVVAVDHAAQRTHVAALCEHDDPDAVRWLDDAEALVREALAAPDAPQPRPDSPQPRLDAPQPWPLQQALAAPDKQQPWPADEEPQEAHVEFRCGRGREQYLADIARCQAALTAGESYEVCLTDQIHTDASPEPLELYRLLRRRNPAPFAAYLKLGEMAVVSSSPERFIGVDRERRVQARPIKGTAPRSSDPERDAQLRESLLNDEKTFAEHLMIVDLLRNDLGRVCEVDTVRVPQFMVVEPYTTVHQLISTITGVLDSKRTPVEAVRACFPGGSMTGAPKLRTMGIIDDIEREARGVYSGAIGYFGVDGSVDLSIVIRTIVLRGAGATGRTTIGAGGAIVMQSDPQEEFEEILLKARAPMSALARAVTGSDAPEAWTVVLEPDAVAAGVR
jgi:para-aminobenzoate synthetase